MKKIAVASDDRTNLALHFGRTKGFLIFHIEDRKIKKVNYLENSCTGHSQGHHYENQAHHHSHAGILQALHDCDVVISHGMGRRLMNDLEEHGKEVFVSTAPSAESAIKGYLDGTLVHSPHKSCEHHKNPY